MINHIVKTGLTIILTLISFIINAQSQKEIDSLIKVLKNEKNDTSKVKTYINLFFQYQSTDDVKAKECLNKAFELSLKIGFKKGLARTYVSLGNLADFKGNYNEALKNYKEALKIWEKIGDQENISYSLDNIGCVYANQGKYFEALKNFFESLKIWIEIGDKRGISTSYNNIGNIYDNLGNYPEALKNHFASLKIREEIGYKDGVATSYNNIGAIYEVHRNYSEALKKYFASLKIWEEVDNIHGIASTFNNIGNIYSFNGNNQEALKYYLISLKKFKDIGDKQGMAELYNSIGSVNCEQGNYSEALKNHLTSLKIMEENNDADGVATSLINIGKLYTKLNKLKEASDYFNQALLISNKIGNIDDIKYCYNGLVIIDSIQGNFNAAFDHHKLFIIYKDSLDNVETKKKTIQTQMTYEFEKKEIAAKVKQDKKDALTAAESRKQKLVIAFMIIGLLFILIIAVIIFRSLRITRKQKQTIETQKYEIEAQRDLVSQQKDHIEHIFEEQTDSIRYAERIQKALLPDLELLFATGNQYSVVGVAQSLSKCKQTTDFRIPITDYFIIFKPKDIVSGDFYYVAQRKNLLLTAVADCTGHGVPGAFMSMLGISFLNEIIAKEEIQSAGHVLDELRQYVIRSLQQKGIQGEQQDGMDISFIILNTENYQLQYAGANNPLWIVETCNDTVLPMLHEIRPDKMPVGIYANIKPFQNNILQVNKGDRLYIFSDGFIDQFGGENHKKFLSKRFKETLVNLAHLPMSEQYHNLKNVFESWKGNGDQIDDVTVMGIRI